MGESVREKPLLMVFGVGNDENGLLSRGREVGLVIAVDDDDVEMMVDCAGVAMAVVVSFGWFVDVVLF